MPEPREMDLRSYAYPKSALNIAVSRGNIQNVKTLIEEGCDVNKTDQEGATAWHYCVFYYENFKEIAELLFEAGAKMDIKDAYGNTPLMLAVMNGSVATADWLLKKDLRLGFDSEAQKTDWMKTWRVSEDMKALLEQYKPYHDTSYRP